MSGGETGAMLREIIEQAAALKAERLKGATATKRTGRRKH